jgi:hypothetical protein
MEFSFSHCLELNNVQPNVHKSWNPWTRELSSLVDHASDGRISSRALNIYQPRATQKSNQDVTFQFLSSQSTTQIV